MEIEKDNIVSFSFASAALTGMITAFIVIGLLSHLILVPMNEETNARIEEITFNESQFNELKSGFEAMKDYTENIQEEVRADVQSIENKTKILWDEKGEWECTQWKQYDDLDCAIATNVRNVSIVENTTTCLWSDNERSGTYTFQDLCEEWRYIR